MKKCLCMLMALLVLSANIAMPCYAIDDGWHKTSDGKWTYIDNGKLLVYTWLTYDGVTYYLDKSGIMRTGWIKDGNNWYYMDGSGAMVKNKWIKTNGKWYYLSFSGAMLTNSITPDGYTVDENGVWLEDISPVNSSDSGSISAEIFLEFYDVLSDATKLGNAALDELDDYMTYSKLGWNSLKRDALLNAKSKYRDTGYAYQKLQVYVETHTQLNFVINDVKICGERIGRINTILANMSGSNDALDYYSELVEISDLNKAYAEAMGRIIYAVTPYMVKAN